MATVSTQNWFVYIVRCADQSLYTGVTTDIERRVIEHNTCDKKGARYTRARRPVTLCYTETLESRATACKREIEIKKLTKTAKEQLAASEPRL